MKILLINQDWFAAEWRALGHEVLTVSYNPGCDVKLEVPLIPVQELSNEFQPDRIVVHDNSSPVLVAGLEDIDIPTVFYSVDAHHHTHYHKYLAGAFDLTFVAQKDFLPQFEEQGNPVHWLPLYASRVVEASAEKKYGAVFVGTMDPKLNPDRVAFFNELKSRVPLVIERGEYWKIFPFSDIVVNQTVKGDLNFRVFEVMMCGAMLLTERASNGLDELFISGTHMVSYEKGNVAEAAALITEYLSNLDRCRAIAAAGRAEVVAKHLPQHRALTVMDFLAPLTKRQSRMRYFGMMTNYTILSVTFEPIEQNVARAALLRALRCAEIGLSRGETINHDFCCHLVLAAMRYDQKVPGRSGSDLLKRFGEKFPQQAMLHLGRIRDHLNYGEREAADSLAAQFGSARKEEIFALAEKLATELMGKVL